MKTCAASGDGWTCDKPHDSKGLCRGHRTQLARGKPLTKLRVKRPPRKVERHDPSDMFCRIREGYQRCVDCGEELPLEEFYIDNDRPNKRKSSCRRCTANMLIDKTYGAGAAQWKEAKLAEQGGRCGMCETDTPVGGKWHLDHDHKTNEWRDVLCFKCNVTVGFLENSGGWGARKWLAAAEERGYLT